MSELTIKQLDSMIQECFRLKEQYTDAKKVASDYYAKLEEMQQHCIAALQSVEKTSYSSPYGNFRYSVRESFRTPKTLEAREAFFAYLKSKGLFDSMITVNNATLNSWAKQEVESCPELDMQIPGLEKSEPTFVASMTKK